MTIAAAVFPIRGSRIHVIARRENCIYTTPRFCFTTPPRANLSRCDVARRRASFREIPFVRGSSQRPFVTADPLINSPVVIAPRASRDTRGTTVGQLFRRVVDTIRYIKSRCRRGWHGSARFRAKDSGADVSPFNRVPSSISSLKLFKDDAIS